MTSIPQAKQLHYRGYTLTREPYPQLQKDGSWTTRPEDARGGWRHVLTDEPLRPLEEVKVEVDAMLGGVRT